MSEILLILDYNHNCTRESPFHVSRSWTVNDASSITFYTVLAKEAKVDANIEILVRSSLIDDLVKISNFYSLD